MAPTDPELAQVRRDWNELARRSGREDLLVTVEDDSPPQTREEVLEALEQASERLRAAESGAAREEIRREVDDHLDRLLQLRED